MDITKSKNSMEAFFANQQVVRIKKSDILLRPTDAMTHILFLKSGFVRMYSLMADGKELTVNIFKPGSYFPLFLAFDNKENTYFYQAMSTGSMQKLPKNEVMNYIRSHDEILFDFTKRMTIGFHGLLQNIQHQLFGSVRIKIHATLLMLVRRFGKQTNVGYRIAIPLTHQDIANLTGVARETASLELGRLQKLHIIKYAQKTILVKNIQFLEHVG